jgi:hypothetical protein
MDNRFSPIAPGDVDPRFVVDFSVNLATTDIIVGTPSATMSTGGPTVLAVAVCQGQAGDAKAVGLVLTAGTGMSSEGYALVVTVYTQAGLRLNRAERIFVKHI